MMPGFSFSKRAINLLITAWRSCSTEECINSMDTFVLFSSLQPEIRAHETSADNSTIFDLIMRCSFLFNPHNLPGAQRYFITQYINFTNQIPTMQISNIYMLNIFTDIKQSSQTITISVTSLNTHYG
ncbi:conserved hypothetical protein [Escherichia coli]|nr:conserved hypothetical protein [Escherichia coli]SJK88228.1 conserved hypothetical protein [Escherichia coli]SOQ65011.1 conserved hypothetical protein [Escherichia coli]SOQ68390.1 conserved hypothetical protein [Escherichia coli]SOQ71652.1 conserved hypothetical protein [Escherichia coli]